MKYIVEIYRHGIYKRRRMFSSREAAVKFVNDFNDEHYSEERWDLQLVHAGRIEQLNTNGNAR